MNQLSNVECLRSCQANGVVCRRKTFRPFYSRCSSLIRMSLSIVHCRFHFSFFVVLFIYFVAFSLPRSPPPPFSVRIQGTYSSNEITCQQFCDMIAIPYRIWLISTIRYFSDVRVGADTEE